MTDPFSEWNIVTGRSKGETRWLWPVVTLAIIVLPTVALWIANNRP